MGGMGCGTWEKWGSFLHGLATMALNCSFESACVLLCVLEAVMYAERDLLDTLSRNRRG